MKKKITKILTLFLVVMCLSGCTTLLKDNKKKAVKNPETGQNLTQNILCRPNNKITLELYQKNKINVNKLPECDQFKITSGGYEGIWSTIFVKPLAFIIVKLGSLLKNYGLAIIATTLLIRLLTISVTKKSAMQSENMKAAQPELGRLEKKYANKKDQESQMQKNQEMMQIYSKYKINPLSGCLFAVIQIPVFFAFYEAMNRLPVLFEETFLGFQMGTNPVTAMASGHYEYLIFIVLVVAASYLSFKLNSGAAMSGDQAKQMNMMNNMMIFFIGFASLTLSTGIAIYWIANNLFTILQNLVVKRRKLNVKNA